MPVAIRLQCIRDAAVLDVEDRGAAISDADRERLFDRFFRGSTAAGTQGLGLGLALVAEVVRWHHGSVALDRGADGGNVFRVTLPLLATHGGPA
jgi:signal transduction histidine kinase